jgi:hypothetical protein
MSAKQFGRVQQLSSMGSEAPLPAETLDYIAQMSVALRAMALDVGCLTLGAILDVAAREARLQLIGRSRALPVCKGRN